MQLPYHPGTRYNANACVTRSHAVANAFARGGERDCTRSRMRSHGEVNEIARSRERVRTRRRTRSHAVANASHKEANEIARGRERVHTRRRARLHPRSTLACGSACVCVYVSAEITKFHITGIHTYTIVKRISNAVNSKRSSHWNSVLLFHLPTKCLC